MLKRRRKKQPSCGYATESYADTLRAALVSTFREMVGVLAPQTAAELAVFVGSWSREELLLGARWAKQLPDEFDSLASIARIEQRDLLVVVSDRVSSLYMTVGEQPPVELPTPNFSPLAYALRTFGSALGERGADEEYWLSFQQIDAKLVAEKVGDLYGLITSFRGFDMGGQETMLALASELVGAGSELVECTRVIHS